MRGPQNRQAACAEGLGAPRAAGPAVLLSPTRPLRTKPLQNLNPPAQGQANDFFMVE